MKKCFWEIREGQIILLYMNYRIITLNFFFLFFTYYTFPKKKRKKTLNIACKEAVVN